MENLETDVYVACPHCGTHLNLFASLREFQAATGGEALPDVLCASILCPVCDDTTVALFLQPESTVEKREKNTAVKLIIDAVKKGERSSRAD